MFLTLTPLTDLSIFTVNTQFIYPNVEKLVLDNICENQFAKNYPVSSASNCLTIVL